MKIFNIHISIYISFLILSVFFVVYPQIDLTLHSYLYDDGFFLSENIFIKFLYHSVKWVIILPLLTVLALATYNKVKSKNILDINFKKFLFLIIVLSVGPGLIVNAIFKENFGRARPAHIVQFGGDKEFTPAFIISDQCSHNCSFASGHASGAFFAMAFAFLFIKRRKLYLNLAIAYGFLVGFARMAQGGHFFSDVMVSFFVVYLVTYITYDLMFINNKR